MSYTIKGYKSFKGHEGEPCAQGTLALNNKRVADWSDDANGGEFRFDFVNEKEARAFGDYAKEFLKGKVDLCGTPYDLNGPLDTLLREAIQRMSYDYADEAAVKKAIKTHICVEVMENGAPVVLQHKMSYTAKNVAMIREKYGAALTKVFNETYGMPLVSEEAAAMERYRKLCKTAIVFSVKGPDGKIGYFKNDNVYTLERAAAIRAKHPNLVEILNETILAT